MTPFENLNNETYDKDVVAVRFYGVTPGEIFKECGEWISSHSRFTILDVTWRNDADVFDGQLSLIVYLYPPYRY